MLDTCSDIRKDPYVMHDSRRIRPGDELIPTAEASRILQVDRSTLRRWVLQGRVAPVARTNGDLFIKAEIEAFAATDPKWTYQRTRMQRA